MDFMHFQNSCTRNGDHLIFLIKTDKAHKQRILLQTIVSTFKKCEGETLKHSQNDDGGQMVVAPTITDLSYLVVNLFCDLVRPLPYSSAAIFGLCTA